MGVYLTRKRGSIKSCGLRCGKEKDISGKRFGKLQAIKKSRYNVKRRANIWRCKCECGNYINACIIDLTGGKIKSCGCLRYEDFSGKKIGKLSIIKRTKKRPGTWWLAKCECGGYLNLTAEVIRRGKIKSCGCSHGGSEADDLVGKKFGVITVISKCNKYKIGHPRWVCQCDCGNLCEYSSQTLKNKTSFKKCKSKKCSCKTRKIIKTKEGYILLYNPNHKNARKNGYLFEHTYNMSKKIERPLIKNETVHHKNGIKDDNRIENLELWSRNHSPGQRVKDLLEFSKNIISLYGNIKLEETNNV
jgi:hypothetical protein